MKYPDDIDFVYVLQNHGWSNCYINIEGAIYQMGPTHVFDNPIEVLLDAFICLLKGENEVSFKWHDEPGEYIWTVTRNKEQRHKILVSISHCFYMNSPNELNPDAIQLEFEVKQRLFCICILRQMQKIQDLMTEPSFNENRRGQFPNRTFKEFEELYDRTYKK